MFSSDSTEFGGPDNEHTTPVSLGMPGALPVTNEKAVEYSIKTGLALNCSIRNKSVFARKNYFYPDLPKGYQISQFDEPLCENGHVDVLIDGKIKQNWNRTGAHGGRCRKVNPPWGLHSCEFKPCWESHCWRLFLDPI